VVGQQVCTSAGSATCTYGSGVAVTAGDLLVVSIAIRGGAGGTTVSVADDQSNTYTCPAGAYNNDQSAICYDLAAGSTATVIPTVTLSVAATNIYSNFSVYRSPSAEAWSYDEDNTLDVTANTTHSHGSITTTGPGVIVTCSLQNGANTETPNADFTALTNNGARDYFQRRLTTNGVTTTGEYTTAASADTFNTIASWKYANDAAAGTGHKNLLLRRVGEP